MYQPTQYITAYYYFWPPPSGKRKGKKCHINFSKKVISCDIFCIFLVPLQDIIMEGLLGSTWSNLGLHDYHVNPHDHCMNPHDQYVIPRGVCRVHFSHCAHFVACLKAHLALACTNSSYAPHHAQWPAPNMLYNTQFFWLEIQHPDEKGWCLMVCPSLRLIWNLLLVTMWQTTNNNNRGIVLYKILAFFKFILKTWNFVFSHFSKK